MSEQLHRLQEELEQHNREFDEAYSKGDHGTAAFAAMDAMEAGEEVDRIKKAEHPELPYLEAISRDLAEIRAEVSSAVWLIVYGLVIVAVLLVVIAYRIY